MEFSQALQIVLHHEGGYNFVPEDKGGETYQGISRVNHPNWPGWVIVDKNKPLKYNQLINDLELTKMVAVFYKNNFWDKIKADNLPKSIRALAFDYAVNSGTGTAAKTLQRVLRDTTNQPLPVDGVIGQQTIKLAKQVPEKFLFDRYKTARANYYAAIVKNDPKQSKFLKGWLARLDTFQFIGIAAGTIFFFSLVIYLAFKSK